MCILTKKRDVNEKCKRKRKKERKGRIPDKHLRKGRYLYSIPWWKRQTRDWTVINSAERAVMETQAGRHGAMVLREGSLEEET